MFWKPEGWKLEEICRSDRSGPHARSIRYVPSTCGALFLFRTLGCRISNIECRMSNVECAQVRSTLSTAADKTCKTRRESDTRDRPPSDLSVATCTPPIIVLSVVRGPPSMVWFAVADSYRPHMLRTSTRTAQAGFSGMGRVLCGQKRVRHDSTFRRFAADASPRLYTKRGSMSAISVHSPFRIDPSRLGFLFRVSCKKYFFVRSIYNTRMIHV